jgi:lipid-A-disaccharide synthase
MKSAHHLGIPVLWYISPKFWAWKEKKYIGNLKTYATHVAVIFPFEEPLLRAHMPGVTFVGNPLVEYLETRRLNPSASLQNDLRSKSEIALAIVPGSRRQEIAAMLPAMIAAFNQVRAVYPNCKATVSRCGHIPRAMYEDVAGTTRVTYFEGPLEELYTCMDLALVTSGTATLQTALMGVPMVVAYKTSYINYLFFKAVAKKLRHIGLPNIIAGKDIVPECVQDGMTPESMAGHLTRFIESPDRYHTAVTDLTALRHQLDGKKPSVEVTRLIRTIAGLES